MQPSAPLAHRRHAPTRALPATVLLVVTTALAACSSSTGAGSPASSAAATPASSVAASPTAKPTVRPTPTPTPSPTATPIPTLDASLTPHEVLERVYLAMADERFIQEYPDGDLEPTIVIGLSSLAYRKDIAVDRVEFLTPVEMADGPHFQLRLEYFAKVDKERVKVTDLILVNPVTYFAEGIDMDALVVSTGKTYRSNAVVRHLPKLTLSGNWRDQVTVDDPARMITLTASVPEGPDDYLGAIAIRIGTPKGVKLDGTASFLGGPLTSALDITSSASGTSDLMGGSYTEWIAPATPTFFNFVPNYAKAGSYKYVIGLFDFTTDQALVDKDGVTLIKNLTVTVN